VIELAEQGGLRQSHFSRLDFTPSLRLFQVRLTKSGHSTSLRRLLALSTAIPLNIRLRVCLKVAPHSTRSPARSSLGYHSYTSVARGHCRLRSLNAFVERSLPLPGEVRVITLRDVDAAMPQSRPQILGAVARLQEVRCERVPEVMGRVFDARLSEYLPIQLLEVRRLLFPN
jgi:hypothetical protein